MFRIMPLLTRRFRITIAVLLSLPILLVLLDALAPVDLEPRPGSRLVIAADGQPLRAFADRQGVWRYPITLDEVSPNYLEALIGYEDRFFYRHPGVNPLSIIRAFFQAIRYGEVVSGGSTLTMQVARLRYPEPRTLWGKLKEVVRALQLEWHYSKDDILTYYLNHAPFGGTVEGVQAAALTYFGYDVRYLTDAQAALLAVLPQAPTRYRPDIHPQAAQQARNKLLSRLVEQAIWSQARVDDAYLEQVVAIPRVNYQRAPLLSRRLSQEFSGAVVTSTIDADWQGIVERRVRNYVETIDENVSAAVMIMENGTGNVPVYVGSADFGSEDRAGHVDMVQAIRSPGSTLKPFIYGLSMDAGQLHSESLLMDVPLRFGDYQPDNFTGGFSGAVSVQDALQQSLNVPAVQVLEQVGPARLYLRLQQAGALLQLPRGEQPNLAMALGGLGTNLESLVTLFSALDNQGQTRQPRFTDQEASASFPLLSPGSAWIVRKMLADAENAPHGIALKTGTSYGFRDSWAVAVAQGYTVGVWIGRPDGAPVTGHFGRRTAVPLLVNTLVPRLRSNALPPQPDSVSMQTICWPTGQPEPEIRCDEQRDALVLENTLPLSWMQIGRHPAEVVANRQTLQLATDSGLQVPFGCELPSTKKTVALWPLPLDAWRPNDQRVQSRLPVYDPRCDAQLENTPRLPVRIAGLREGDVIIADPSVPVRISLWAEGGQEPFYWYLNGNLQSERAKQFEFIPQSQHRYEVVLMDYQGQLDRQIIEAK